ncbi:hypothetical protein IW22_22105 [Chryseobacterium sp. JM1]|nr:hypothetical protein IW22_22105 [Chryseobacterium sp. JM1]
MILVLNFKVILINFLKYLTRVEILISACHSFFWPGYQFEITQNKQFKSRIGDMLIYIFTSSDNW